MIRKYICEPIFRRKILMAKTVNAPKIMIHVIHNVPPARMNSDESGSPKTAIFGDVLRARLSS